MTDKDPQAAALRRLDVAITIQQQAQQKAVDERAHIEAAVRQALAAGVKVSEVAARLGVTVQRVYQIKNAKS
ncbi:helix-turn-helix domain-containing protein [Paenarthrobacter sp. Y-19]|uniref:helix-turn-helix domain-containing protein n=1 Tax=Paenarthrobacter sp. Y-19 TaxID=3031125 RepID=UPI0023DC59D6|nr:helix-turn-helix domain-containing protein [Paenarthrobacter sp. Y-19]